MKSSILEISQNKKVSGRTYIKWIVHEIHNSIENYNKNGISWKEQFVLNNIESAKGMPIAVEFLDWEKSEPFGHGQSDVKDGVPLFEYSVVVGVTENAYVDTVEVNGNSIRALIGEGYIYNQRYPKLVQWLKSKMYDGEFPETSVEITAKEEEDFIVYENGWKEYGRVPMTYDYSGDAILGIEPADDSAVFLELNNKFKKEDKTMDNKIISELNAKLETKTNEINELKNQISAKDGDITEINSKLEVKVNEFNSITTELNQVKETLVSVEKEKESLTAELNELRKFKQETENKTLVTEFNSKLSQYTDEEKEMVKEKIETFSKEPNREKMGEILTEINNSIVAKLVESRKTKTETPEDIYSDVYSEVNSENDAEDIY